MKKIFAALQNDHNINNNNNNIAVIIMTLLSPRFATYSTSSTTRADTAVEPSFHTGDLQKIIIKQLHKNLEIISNNFRKKKTNYTILLSGIWQKISIIEMEKPLINMGFFSCILPLDTNNIPRKRWKSKKDGKTKFEPRQQPGIHVYHPEIHMWSLHVKLSTLGLLSTIETPVISTNESCII